MQHKNISFKLAASDDQQGFIKAYASTWTLDETNDIIEKGAFKETIKEAQARVDEGKATFLCPMMFNHDGGGMLPIGGWIDLSEDSRGLLSRGQVDLDTQMGREVYSGLKKGYLNAFSIGYDPVQYHYDKSGVRHLTKIRLWEISPVVFPANSEALLVEVKHMRNGRKSFADYLAEERRRKSAYRARKATFPDSTWTAIQLTMVDLNEELAEDEPDMAKVRKLTAKLDGWFHQVPGTYAEDLARTIGTQAGSSQLFAGYDPYGIQKSLDRLKSLKRKAAQVSAKLSPDDRSVLNAQLSHLEDAIYRAKYGVPAPHVKTDAELTADLYRRSGASFNPKLGRFVEG